jgi:hypothetical protein
MDPISGEGQSSAACLLVLEIASSGIPSGRNDSSGEVSSPVSRWLPALANAVKLAHLGTPPALARFFIVFAPAQLLLQAGSFQKFLETPQSRPKGFPVMNTHP